MLTKETRIALEAVKEFHMVPDNFKEVEKIVKAGWVEPMPGQIQDYVGRKTHVYQMCRLTSRGWAALEAHTRQVNMLRVFMDSGQIRPARLEQLGNLINDLFDLERDGLIKGALNYWEITKKGKEVLNGKLY